jgi:hypothetical protein
MGSLVDGVANAVDGGGSGAPGLSELAEVLRGEVSRFVSKARH